ncbi:hypothetical protein Stsp02_25780 [Streptomyces sp. NBRC 14336]|nr:hypothetical protein Stsp02_25780 [Streptomyces sp. NBRC 14336]
MGRSTSSSRGCSSTQTFPEGPFQRAAMSFSLLRVMLIIVSRGCGQRAEMTACNFKPT